MQVLDSDFLKKIQYVVIYKHDKMSADAESMYQRLFTYWKSSWTQLYSMLKSSEILNPEDFWMQDRVTALIYDGQVIGMHLLKDYKKSDFPEHPYFKNYSPEFFVGLQKRDVQQVQSFQFFWVDLAWSKKITGVNFAAIIASLSLKFQKSLGMQASITIARKDIRVHETAEKVGFVELSPASTMHNVSVALMACFEPQLYPDVQVNTWADYFWNNKIEYKSIQIKTGVAA